MRLSGMFIFTTFEPEETLFPVSSGMRFFFPTEKVTVTCLLGLGLHVSPGKDFQLEKLVFCVHIFALVLRIYSLRHSFYIIHPKFSV